MKAIFKPRRGVLEKLPGKLRPHELFYITDYKIIGVTDDEGSPQLFANVEDFDVNAENQKGEKGKLYKDVSSHDLYTYDGKNFEKVNISVHNVDVRLK